MPAQAGPATAGQPAAVHRLVAAEDRAKLEQILGLDHTTLGEMQAGLVIVSPLLASAAAALLPRF
ncbi:hypothetical protein GCM10009682_19420 [Luedemannella flava]|uniref:Uncharacterized protein n=1 Tax=Luedemannella flava TaxID=349316 RepID=A0ABN2LS10_9ACTN